MCNPMAFAIVSMAMSAASTVITTNRQNKMAENQGEAAVENTKSAYGQLLDKQLQTDEAATHDKLQRQLQGARERGRILVAQGQAGVGGNSSLRVLNNAMLQESYDQGVIEANQEGATGQIRNEMYGAYTAGKSGVNMADASAYSQGTQYAMIGMNSAEGFASGYQTGQSFSKVKPIKTGGSPYVPAK